MKIILITGASGYVGAKLYTDLKLSHHKIFGTYFKHRLFKELIQCNLTKLNQVNQLIEKFQLQVIIYTAAVPSSSWCEEHPREAIDLLALLGIKVSEIDSHRFIPIPDLDFKIYHKLKLPHYTYQQAKTELKNDLKIHFNG